ncbi:hypothetical protein ES703_33558 [subsurface metagenome]
MHLAHKAWQTIAARIGSFLPIISILALGAGVLLGSSSEKLSDIVNTSVSGFIDGYSYGAPLLIFLVLAPALSRLLTSRRQGSFGLYVVGWLSVTKILACLWGVLFTVAIFGLPLLPEHSSSLGSALAQTSRYLFSMLTYSHYFWAIYASIITSIIALRVRRLARLLDRSVAGIEQIGHYFQFIIPLFMLAVGVYVQSLPRYLGQQLGLEGTEAGFQTLDILGLHLDPNTGSGMVMTYVVGALLVGAACFIWHFGILGLAKYKVRQFSLKAYFKNYWIKMYPLLWSTSSEALAMPLNLYILKKNAPWVRSSVRRLVAGSGSWLCTNGTLICVFILLGLVGMIMGLRFSLIELLMCIPVVFFISYGIPGIPGELILFAGPLALLLNIAPEVLPLFLTLYIGLQIGLPDSFRTGGNTTNNYVYCILLNPAYERRFSEEELKEEE